MSGCPEQERWRKQPMPGIPMSKGMSMALAQLESSMDEAERAACEMTRRWVAAEFQKMFDDDTDGQGDGC